MPTNRRRVTRNRTNGLTLQIQALFDVGCGWQSYPENKLQELWRQLGPGYLEARSSSDKCWAELILGKPKEF